MSLHQSYHDTYEITLAIFGVDHRMLAALLPMLDTAPDSNNNLHGAAIVAHTTRTADQILGKLEAENFGGYVQLHQHAVRHLAQRLRQGETHVESLLLEILDRLAGKLTYAPKEFADLVASVADLPFRSVEGQLLVRYLQALALNLVEQIEEALAQYNVLLREPWLPHSLRGRLLNSSAICYEMTGVYQEAIDRYQQALALWRRSGDRSREGKLLLNLGSLYAEWREYPQAETYLRQAIDCFVATNNWLDLASAQNELGRVYTELGEWDQALTLLLAVVQRRQLENNWDSLGVAFHTIGYLHLLRGDLDQAKQHLQQSLHYQETNATRVEAYRDLGIIAQIEDDLNAAHGHYCQALTIAEQMNRREMLAPVHYHLAEVLRRLAKHEEALHHYYAAVDVIETARTPLQDESLKISLLGRWQQVYETLVLYCLELGRPADAFQWAERTRARAFADKVVADNGVTTAASALVTTAMLQAALPADTALLLYFTTGVLAHDMPMWERLVDDHPLRTHLLTPARTLFFWLTADSFVAAFCPIDPNLFVSSDLMLGNVETFLDPDTVLGMSEVLLTPVGQCTGVAQIQSLKKVFVVPHGPLHQVPFELLFDQLVAPSALSLRLAYAPSGAILYHLWRQTAAPPPDWLAQAVTVGYNTDFLQHAEAEAQFVAHLVGGVAWTGPARKKVHLRQSVGAAGLLHIACHGEFIADEPMHSYLEIGAGERLTAAEILQEWQLHARLVTVSACQTGVVQVLRGDEPMGLVRALLAAGARAVLVSRWPVEDTATFLLMHYFYTELLHAERITPVEYLDLALLLQTAQSWLRRLTSAEIQGLFPTLPFLITPDKAQLAAPYPFAHPRYWAAFMLVGE